MSLRGGPEKAFSRGKDRLAINADGYRQSWAEEVVAIAVRGMRSRSAMRGNFGVVVLALCVGSSLVRCQSPGGFGSPAPAPSQCDIAGPRKECGACSILFCTAVGCCDSVQLALSRRL